MKLKYGMRKQRGGLEESLATSKYVNEYEFNKLVKDYSYYCFDERCNQILFIANDMSYDYTWLFIELSDYQNNDFEPIAFGYHNGEF